MTTARLLQLLIDFQLLIEMRLFQTQNLGPAIQHWGTSALLGFAKRGHHDRATLGQKINPLGIYHGVTVGKVVIRHPYQLAALSREIFSKRLFGIWYLLAKRRIFEFWQRRFPRNSELF